MPYSYPDNIPDAIKKLPAHAQEIFVAAYNSAHKQYDGDEDKANATAWAAVKRGYEQVEGEWRKKAMSEKIFWFVDIIDKNELQFEKDGTATSEIQFFAMGKWQHERYGEIRFDEDRAKQAIKNYQKAEKELNIDYNHLGTEGGPDEAIASGWLVGGLKETGQRGENKEKKGLWGIVKWTKKAAEYIKSGEYKYISPEFTDAGKDKKTGKKIGFILKAAALTNRPWFEGMAPVACSERVLAEIDKVSLDEILSDISAWLTKSAPVLKGKKGSPAIRLYLRGVKEKLGGLIKKQNTKSLAEESLDDKREKITKAYRQKFIPRSVYPCPEYGHWVNKVYETYLIVEKEQKLFKVPYTVNGDEVEFGDPVEVEEVYQEKKTLTEGGAEMDRKLLCAQLGLKETVADGEITAELKRLRESQGHKKLAESLGLKDQATEQDVLDAVKKLKEAGTQKKGAEGTVKLAEFRQVEKEAAEAKKLAEANKKEADGLKLELLEKKRDSVIEKAMAKGKIVPANKELWEGLYMKDPDGATKMIDAQPVVLNFEENGSAGNMATGNAGEQLSVKCAEKRTADPKLSYSEALMVVQRENPDLAKECAREAGL